MPRIALVAGIDNYPSCGNLSGCVKDANSISELLAYNGDDQRTRNFDCNTLTAEMGSGQISRSQLKDAVEKLFNTRADTALFYFAGHGHIESSGGYILASDARRGDEGLSLRDLVGYANSSPATNKVIILDSCHSGAAGNIAHVEDHAAIAEGVTILTASASDQYAEELPDGSHGVYTDLLIDALSGSAASLTGDITPGSIYAHIDQSLGIWQQRPVFKTNTERFISLRKVRPSISVHDLRMISELFPAAGYYYKLDPSYEPRDEARTEDMPVSNPDHVRLFAILQKYNRLNLVVPCNAEHMWNAAMESTGCELTLLGEHYRRLSCNGRL